MAKTLGIYVTSDRYLDMVLHVCRAAKNKGVETHVFFTHTGTKLCTDPRMDELRDLAAVAVCKVGFEAQKLDRSRSKLEDRSFSSQAWHAEMIYDCDRYLTF